MDTGYEVERKPIGIKDLEQDLNRIGRKLEQTEKTDSEKLSSSRLNPEDELVNEQFLLYVNGVGCSTRGNIIGLIGKGKSKKSMLLSAYVSTLLGGTSFSAFKAGQIETDKSRGAYFDTEQSKRHCQLQYRRIKNLSGPRKINSRFDYFMLRPNDPKERMKMIETAVYSNEYDFIVIDGIADLLSKGVNDEEESIHIMNLLMKWSLERDLNIITVLHQNKGDSNAKGHIGSQLTQKSETVFQVEKDSRQPEISTVSSPFTRGMEIDPFHFSLDGEGVPFVVEDFENKDEKKSMSKTPFSYEREVHINILRDVFKNDKELKLSNLKETLRYVLEKYDIQIGEMKSRDWVTFYKKEELIIQEGQMKPYKPSKSVR